jgi:hypothetical protein
MRSSVRSSRIHFEQGYVFIGVRKGHEDGQGGGREAGPFMDRQGGNLEAMRRSNNPTGRYEGSTAKRRMGLGALATIHDLNNGCGFVLRETQEDLGRRTV